MSHPAAKHAEYVSKEWEIGGKSSLHLYPIDILFNSEMNVFEDVLLHQGSDNKKRKSLNSYLSNNKETE